MLQQLLGSSKDDICPNCGTACLANQVLCPKCGKKLDELYEQLPAGWPGTRPILHIRPEHAFLALWIAATAIGIAVAEGWLVDLNLPPSVAYAAGLARGIIPGTLQWMVLRNRIPRSWQWVIVTTLGMVATGPAENLGFEVNAQLLPREIVPLGGFLETAFGFFFGGIALGFIQWLALRKPLQGAWRWIVVTGVSWSLGFVLSYDILIPIFYPTVGFLGFPQYGPNPVADFVISGSRGILIGIFTGLLLIWLLQRNRIGVPLGRGLSLIWSRRDLNLKLERD